MNLVFFIGFEDFPQLFGKTKSKGEIAESPVCLGAGTAPACDQPGPVERVCSQLALCSKLQQRPVLGPGLVKSKRSGEPWIGGLNLASLQKNPNKPPKNSTQH